MTTNVTETVPKTIWLMWLQGLDHAPHVVKECYSSWQTRNPGWRVVFLDETNVGQYVDLEAILAKQSHLEKPALSDIIRVKLLAEYGGVWVDATCFCQVPLDDWLNGCTTSGFFAFAKPDRSRPIDAWFMAASRGSYLAQKLAEATEAYWLENPQLARRPKVARCFKPFSADTRTTGYWFLNPVKKVFKIYPYMWLPYLFTELLRRDAQSQRLWAQTKKMGAARPHSLQRAGLLEPLTEQLKDEIDHKKVPVYKLTWKYDTQSYSAGCVLDYLFASNAGSHVYARRAQPSTSLPRRAGVGYARPRRSAPVLGRARHLLSKGAKSLIYPGRR